MQLGIHIQALIILDRESFYQVKEARRHINTFTKHSVVHVC